MRSDRELNVNTFKQIHSFIMEIYIAPLQGYYKESLPIPAQLKGKILRLE